VEQPRHVVADIDEDTEVGVAIDCSTVVAIRRQLVGFCALELEDDILLVEVTDTTVDRFAADDARTH
jgi:hypothetical protein